MSAWYGLLGNGVDDAPHPRSGLYRNDCPAVEGSFPFAPFGNPVADRGHDFIRGMAQPVDRQ